jgi:hypothetical protein
MSYVMHTVVNEGSISKEDAIPDYYNEYSVYVYYMRSRQRNLPLIH